MAQDDVPVFFLKLDDQSGPKLRITRASELPEAARRVREWTAADPGWQAHLQRFQAVVARGAAPVALVDEPLPDGAVAHVLVDPGAQRPRLVVVPTASLNDEVLVRAQQALRSYEISAPDDPEQVEITLWSDGRVRVERASGSREFRPRIRMGGIHELGYAEAIKKRAAAVAPSDVQKVGRARIVEPLGKTRRKQP